MDKIYLLIQNTPMVQKVAGLFMLMALLIAGHWYLIYRDQQTTKLRLDREYQKLENELLEKKDIAQNLVEFKKKVESLSRELEEKQKNLPDDANIDQLLKTLNKLSENTDIRIKMFAPRPEVRKGFYSEIPVFMELEGNYHEIVSFFDKISKEDRIINITDINMTNPVMRNGKIVVAANCMAKTFRSLPLSEQRDDEADKKTKTRKPPKKKG